MAGMSEQLDRFARGELSPRESRELAQQALRDGDLFDELTATAIARRGLTARPKKAILWPRIAIFAAAAAVVAGAVAVYAPRQHSEAAPSVSAIRARPVLLARNADSTSFRGVETESR